MQRRGGGRPILQQQKAPRQRRRARGCSEESEAEGGHHQAAKDVVLGVVGPSAGVELAVLTVEGVAGRMAKWSHEAGSGFLLTAAGTATRLMSFAEGATYSLCSARLAICRLRRLVATSRQPWVYFIAEAGQNLLEKFSVAESGKDH